MPSLKKIKQISWKFYDSWRSEKTFSPVLGSEVRVSLKGWYHLTGAPGTKKRSVPDIIRRLKILPLAKKTIESKNATHKINKRKNKLYHTLETEHENIKIRVVLIEDKLGNKIFYSVMDRSVETNKKGAPHA